MAPHWGTRGQGPRQSKDSENLTHFDHERIPERVVHARGTGAHGYFTNYNDSGHLSAASFLGAKEKKTPVFVQFPTVTDHQRDAANAHGVHGFNIRFFTDEGNLDIVGNNIPVTLGQNAHSFPDSTHSAKEAPNNEMNWASAAHDSDTFSKNMHAFFWIMAGYGMPRSVRHMQGFSVHTYQFVTAHGDSKFVKWLFKSKQGIASLLWDEAQQIASKNINFHHQDLFDAIQSGNYPEWEVSVQIFSEEDALALGFDAFDSTKFIPEELVPLKPLGILQLNSNVANDWTETEQIMFRPENVIRGIEHVEDPAHQGRFVSHFGTQPDRHSGHEQLPSHGPVVGIQDNHRHGTGHNLGHTHEDPYGPHIRNKGFPAQPSQNQGREFFSTHGRGSSGHSVHERSKTFNDHWSQPRLFYNSISKVDQQLLINAIRFETSQVRPDIQKTIIFQLNKISHDIARRVAEALGQAAPEPDPTYYHDNKTAGLSIFCERLLTIAGLNVGIFASNKTASSLVQAQILKAAFLKDKVQVNIVAERLGDGVDRTFAASDATAFDGMIVTDGIEALFSKRKSPLYPEGRPSQIITDGYKWGKPIGFLGSSQAIVEEAGAAQGAGVYVTDDVDAIISNFRDGLGVFKFTDRFALDG